MKMRLSIFAYHVSVIMNADAPSEFSLAPCEGILAEVKIVSGSRSLATLYTKEGDKSLDQVYINGNCAGNRQGGMQEFVKLVCESKPEIIFD